MITKVTRQRYTIYSEGATLYAVPGVIVSNNVICYTSNREMLGYLVDVIKSEKEKAK